MNPEGAGSARTVRGARAAAPPPRSGCRQAPPGPEASGPPPCQTRRRRPLGDLNAAMRDLDLDAAGVQALLDEGKLIGFNISGRSGRRMAVRVLTQSVDHYWRTGRALNLAGPELLAILLPGAQPFVPGLALQRCLNCDPSQVTAIIRAGHVRVVKGSRCGWGGSPMITRSSFESFLMSRRL